MTLRSPICDSLKIDVPIVLAGMGGASTPALAAAVSNAGGLGVLGAAAVGPKALREMIEETRSLTDGRGVAAAMMLGTAGAWVGTAFRATEEASFMILRSKRWWTPANPIPRSLGC